MTNDLEESWQMLQPPLTPRESFIMALEGKQPPGLVPTFEMVFLLTMEAFGRIHPTHRVFSDWGQMSASEKRAQRRDLAETYVQIARTYGHGAIYCLPPKGWKDRDAELMLMMEAIRELSGMEFCLLMPGDATYSIPDGEHMMQFVVDLAERPQEMKDNARRQVEQTLAMAENFRRHGVLDGFALCCDYCYNDRPFLSPAMFDEFIQPYLCELVAGEREMGFYVIKHTDGNIMPILDRLVAARPHALHSLDPQGGVDMAEVKRLVGDKVCLIGNVNCGLLDTGTDEQVVEAARYALRHGMGGGGYIFSTSNSVYTGMPLRRYELMLQVRQSEGWYGA